MSYHLVDLIDVTLACEDANLKPVEVVIVAEVDDDDRVGKLNQLFSNVENLFTALSSCCDIIKQLASFTGIKRTKQKLVSELVILIVSYKGSQ